MQTKDVQGGGNVFFTQSSKALAATNDGQVCLSAKYFHVIGSLFLQLAKDNFINAGVIDYLTKCGMKVSLGSMCAEPERKISVHSLVAYAKKGHVHWQRNHFVSGFPGSLVSIYD